MPKFLPRLSVIRRQGPPILATQEADSPAALNAYALTELVVNLTFTGGTHVLTATHALTSVAPNITFTGGTHSLVAAHSLTTIKANVAFAGGTHSLQAQRSLTTVTANITFTGGTHVLTYTPGAAAYSLTSVAPNLQFTGGTHLLHWSGETVDTGGAGGRVVRPQETLRHYRLWQHPADLRLIGGTHELIYDNSATLDDEESLLLLVE